MSSTYIDEALATYLLSKSDVTTYIGNRFYQAKAPESSPVPYAYLRLIEADNEPQILGTEKMGHHLFEIVCVSQADRTPSHAFLAAQKIIGNLRGYQGSMDGVTVRFIINISGPEESPDPAYDDRTNASVSFEIEFEEVA